MALLAYIGQVTHLKKMCQITRAVIKTVLLLRKVLKCNTSAKTQRGLKTEKCGSIADIVERAVSKNEENGL